MDQSENKQNQHPPKAKGTSLRGFASMDPAQQRAIASKGGRAAHAQGTAHEFTPEEARIAGRKGGEAVSQDRRHMAEIGAEGGRARAESHRNSRQNITANSADNSNPQ